MILLLGGTADTNEVALALVHNGFSALVSTATNHPLSLAPHPQIEKRSGKLNRHRLTDIIVQRRITAVVDATHPYAEKIGPAAHDVAHELGIPYFRYMRPASVMNSRDMMMVTGHESAAEVAFAIGAPVLLTIGALNVAPYAVKAKETRILLAARVLDRAESIDACRKAGISRDRIIVGQGPFSIANNIALIHQFNIGVLVTKDGGEKGGFPEKIEAARQTDCRVIAIKRPSTSGMPIFEDVTSLLQKMQTVLTASPNLSVLTVAYSNS